MAVVPAAGSGSLSGSSMAHRRQPAPSFMLAATFVVGALAAGCGGAAQGPLARLHPCSIDEGPTDAYCGTYRVFEDRTARQGRTIDLKIVVAPALRRDAQPDPLFIFEGGPGGGAATLAPYRLPLFRRFQTDRDIVLIDQRGTGDSNALDCSREEEDDEDLANIDARDYRGRTPFRLAEGSKQSFQFQDWPETAALLRKLGANVRLGIPGTVQERIRDVTAPVEADQQP
jgi:pimeloyl-ACP methyl ester carboxylesterase